MSRSIDQRPAVTADKQQPLGLSTPFATTPYRKRRADKGAPSEARWRIVAVNGKVMATTHSERVCDLVYEALMVEYRNKKAKKA